MSREKQGFPQELMANMRINTANRLIGVPVAACNTKKIHLSSVMRKPMFCFITWFDTNQAVQLQKMARGLKFRILKKRDCTIYVAKTKALISFAVTAKLIRVFVFAYAKR